MPADVAVAAMFRDSQVWHGRRIDQVDRFFQQIEANAAAAGVSVEYHLVEGNSTDDTWAALCDHQYRYSPRTSLYRHVVQGSDVASVVSETRFANLSAVGNVALRGAKGSGAPFVFWVESDFVLEDDVLARLLDAPRQQPASWDTALGVCPVPVLQQGGGAIFYDVWAFEGPAGETWGNHDLARLVSPAFGRYRPLRTAGSAMLMNGDTLRAYGLDFGTGCFPALCRAAYDRGLWLDLDQHVYVRHPSAALVAGRWV